MNRKKERINQLIKKQIINIDINFNNVLDKISYKNYCFSGFPIPEDVKYEILFDKLYITWKIDDFANKGLYCFICKIKVNDKEAVRETIFNTLNVYKYETNVEYEFKARVSTLKGLGNWSEVIKFKIDDSKKYKSNNSTSTCPNPFKLINKDSEVNKNKNPFFNFHQKTSSFESLNGDKNDINLNIFNSNSNQKTNLFNNNNSGNEKIGLFGNNNNSTFSSSENENNEKGQEDKK